MSSESFESSTKESTVCCTASSASSAVNEIPELHGSYTRKIRYLHASVLRRRILTV